MLQPESTAAALQLAEICFARERHNEAYGALEKACSTWQDPLARAALYAEVGRAAEARGESKRAQAMFEQAASYDSTALDA